MIRLIALRLLESYFRHRWLYLLPCIVMGGVGAAYISQLSSTYISTGTIYVQDKTLLASLTSYNNDGFGWITPAQATVNELNELFTTDAFLRAVVKNTDLEVKIGANPDAVPDTISEAREAIWTYTLGNNLVLIGAAHEMPRIALQLVESTTETYILWKTNLSHNDSITAQDFFAKLIKSYRTEVEPARAELAVYLAAHPKPLRGERPEEEEIEIARLTANLSRAEERLQHAENQEESARLAMAQTESDVRQAYSVVDTPERPIFPERSKKDMAVTLAMFLIAGGFITVTGIVGGALLDMTFRFPIDVKHGLNLPTMAMVGDEAIAVSLRRKKPLATAATAELQPEPEKMNGNGASEESHITTDPPSSNGVRRRRRIFG